MQALTLISFNLHTGVIGGVDDGVLVFLHKLYSHLDKPKSYARSMFMDFL